MTQYQKTVETSIFYTWKASLLLLIFIGAGLSFSIIFVLKLGFPKSIIWVGFFIFFICPILLNTFWKKMFTKKAQVNFLDDIFSISTFDKKTGLPGEQKDYRLDGIQSFKTIASAKDDSAVLKLNLIDGSKITYTFLDQKGDPENNVTFNIHQLIRSYNLTQSINKQIVFAPSLFATKAGKYYALALTILLLGTLILQIIYKPKSIPFSLITGIFTYIRILSQMKKDKESFQKMKY